MTEERTWRQRIARELRGADSFPVILVLIVFVYLFVPTIAAWTVAGTVMAALVCVVCLLALLASDHNRRAIELAAVWSLVTVVAAAVGEDALSGYKGPANLMSGGLLLYTLVVVLVRILQHPTVTVRTVSGAVCVYFFISLAFASFYQAIYEHDPSTFLTASPPLDRFDLAYFSMVSISTAGGDVTPNSDFTRALSSVESVLGQVFLVTLVAALVGNLGRDRLQRMLHAEREQDEREAVADDEWDEAADDT